MHPDILAGRLTIEEGRAKRFRDLAEHCGVAISDEEALGLAKEYRRIYCDSELVSQGAHDLLHYCQSRFTIGIVTNNIRIEQETQARNLGIDQYIDFIVTYENVGVMKPDPKMLQKALEHAKASSDEAVLIGDSLATDVAAAIRMDMRCIWLCSDEDYERKGRPQHRKVVRINSLREAIGVLEGFQGRQD